MFISLQELVWGCNTFMSSRLVQLREEGWKTIFLLLEDWGCWIGRRNEIHQKLMPLNLSINTDTDNSSTISLNIHSGLNKSIIYCCGFSLWNHGGVHNFVVMCIISRMVRILNIAYNSVELRALRLLLSYISPT